MTMPHSGDAEARNILCATIDHNRYYIENGEKIGYAPGYKEKLQGFIQESGDGTQGIQAAKFADGSDAIYTMFGRNTRELGCL